MLNDMPNARFIGKVGGKRAFRFKVRALFNNSRLCATIATADFDVIAHNAADAANYVRDMFGTRPETEIVTFGPKGGRTTRFVGWHSAIGNAIDHGYDIVSTQRRLF